MRPEEIRRLRSGLGLTQAEMGQLMGIHAMTVSKWERGTLTPSEHQAQLLETFRAARDREPEIGVTIARLLLGGAAAVALYYLLRAAFGDRRGPRRR